MEPHHSPAAHQEQASQRSSRVAVSITSNKPGKIRSHETQQKGYAYVCWTIQITILMRITSAGTSTVPLDVGCVQSVMVDTKPPNTLTELTRTTGSIRMITDMRREAFHGDRYSRVEFSWAHIVPGSMPSPQAMGPSDPPFLHAKDTILSLQRNPAGSIGTANLRMARPPKLSRSIEPA